MVFTQGESTTTLTAGGLNFSAKGAIRQGHAVPRSLRVKPGAKHPVWKTRSNRRHENQKFRPLSDLFGKPFNFKWI